MASYHPYARPGPRPMRGVGGAPIRGAMHVLVGGGGGGSYSGGGAYGGGLRQGIIAGGGGGYPAALSSRGGGGYRPMPGRQQTPVQSLLANLHSGNSNGPPRPYSYPSSFNSSSQRGGGGRGGRAGYFSTSTNSGQKPGYNKQVKQASNALQKSPEKKVETTTAKKDVVKANAGGVAKPKPEESKLLIDEKTKKEIAASAIASAQKEQAQVRSASADASESAATVSSSAMDVSFNESRNETINELFAKMVWKKLELVKDSNRLHSLQTDVMNLLERAIAEENE